MTRRTYKSNIQAGFALAAVTALSASVIGATSVSAMQSGQSTNKMTAATKQVGRYGESKAATDLRNGLNTLLQEHVTTNLTVNRLIASGASDAEIDAAVQAQFANTASLAGAIESIYGSAAAAEFTELFNEHIEASNEFAVAVASGDEAAQEEAIIELKEYLVDITEFFVGAIPVLPYDAVYGLLLQHEELMNQSTQALIDQNFGQSKKIEQQALKQISVIANALASGIIATQPAKF